MSRLRIAFFSPFNPQKSGVSDYSEELLPHLAELADVDLVAGPYRLSNPLIAGRFRVLTGEEYLQNAAEYDMPVYQVANSYYQHAYMIPYMEAHPGVVVLHDYYLHYLVSGLTLLKGDFPAIRKILKPLYGRESSGIAWRLLLSLADPYRISLTRPLLNLSRAVVTHSQCAKDLVIQSGMDRDVRVIPMAMPEIDTGMRNQLRQKHGMAPDDFVLASVSTLSYTKRIEVILSVIPQLRQRFPGLRLWILGGGRLGDHARDMIESAGLSDCVHLTGWTSPGIYEEILVAVDAVVDLRYPSGAETSASLLRAVSAGKPAIVSDQGTFQELPDSFTRKIRVGEGEAERLSAAIAELVDNPELRNFMSIAATNHARQKMQLKQAARDYIDFICETKSKVLPAISPSGLCSEAGRGQRAIWGSLYRAGRIAHLLRNYGWQVAFNRIREQVKVGDAA